MINDDKFNIHYLFSDNGHFMDAFIFNKCESQLLGIIHETCKLADASIDVNVEPIAEGSLWSRLKLTSKDGKEIKVQWILALAIAFTINPLSKTLDNILDSAYQYVIDGSYIHNLKKEKERLELEKEVRELKADSARHATTDRQNKIKRKVSNFYSEAIKDARITSIGFSTTAGNPDSSEVIVHRHSFESYIISDTMEDETRKSNVRIDIISPVLKKRNIKWQGIYNSMPIPFKLSDSDFKNSVLKGDVDFTGGTYIICDLIIYTAVNKEGDTKISGYEVCEVHSCGKDDNPPEITIGERKRQQKKAIENAPSLFDFDNEA